MPVILTVLDSWYHFSQNSIWLGSVSQAFHDVATCGCYELSREHLVIIPVVRRADCSFKFVCPSVLLISIFSLLLFRQLTLL
jgi:hypothetical protein